LLFNVEFVDKVSGFHICCSSKVFKEKNIFCLIDPHRLWRENDLLAMALKEGSKKHLPTSDDSAYCHFYSIFLINF